VMLAIWLARNGRSKIRATCESRSPMARSLDSWDVLGAVVKGIT